VHGTQSAPATFMSVRRGVNRSGVSATEFASLDFQQDSSNFRYLNASEIANLQDNVHGNVMLIHQSYAICNEIT